MYRKLHLLVFFLGFFQFSDIFAQIPTPAFANRYGGSGSDYGTALCTYPDGSSVFMGTFASSITLGTTTHASIGGSDAFVCKANAEGQVLWSKTLAGVGDQVLSQVWVDVQGQVYVVGEYNSASSFAGTTILHVAGKEGMVAKLAADGTLIWVKTATNDANADYNELAVDGAGNVYAFGIFSGSLSLGNTDLTAVGSGNNLVVTKYNPQGDEEWAKRYGNGGSNALAIWVSAQGECTLAGDFLGAVTFGTTTHTSNGISDVYLARLDVEGDPVWSHSFGGSSVDNTFGITGDAQGNLFVSGTFMQTMSIGTTSLTSNGDWDVFTAKFLPDGQPEWAVSYGGNTNDRANDIAVDASGNVYIYGWYQNTMTVGTTTLTSLGEYDVFLIKMQPNGVPIWAYSFGGNSFDVGAGIGLDAVGNLYMNGDFYSSNFTVGSINLSPQSGNDVFLVRLGTTPTAIQNEITASEALIRINSVNQGWLQVEVQANGRLQLVNLAGQSLFDGPLRSGTPLSIPSKGNLVLFRFRSDCKEDFGKWLGY